MGGKVSAQSREKYNKKTYDQINFRLRKESYPSKADIEVQAASDRMSLNAWILSALTEKLDRVEQVSIPDVKDYAGRAGMTAEEYIRQAVEEKMRRQDQEIEEGVTEHE